MAYGQTGSGKTFTMEGDTSSGSTPAAAEGDDDADDDDDEEEEEVEDAAAAAAAAKGEGEGVGTAGGGAALPLPVLPPTAGVNPRALAELFRLKAEREAQGTADVEVRAWARVCFFFCLGWCFLVWGV